MQHTASDILRLQSLIAQTLQRLPSPLQILLRQRGMNESWRHAGDARLVPTGAKFKAQSLGMGANRKLGRRIETSSGRNAMPGKTSEMENMPTTLRK